MFLRRRLRWVSVTAAASPWRGTHRVRPYASHYPRRPRRDLYELEDDADGHGEQQNNHHHHHHYERSWRDRLYDHRKALMRVGLFSAVAGGYYWYNLEDAPITGRRRFMTMSAEQEAVLARLSLQQIVSEFRGAILPDGHPAVRYVERIVRRVLAAVDPALLADDTRWRVFVVESETANAFVLPGGEIFVFTGLLPVAQTEDGLAAIIGHEIAHKLVRHGAEKMSFYQFFTFAASILQVFVLGGEQIPFAGLLQQLFLFLPFSRRMETEADYIGLLLMARACYDPREAVGLWQRMQGATKGASPPAFMSTHPSHDRRIEKIREWLPLAMAEYEKAGCPGRERGRGRSGW